MFHLLVGGNALRIVNATPSDVLVVRAHRLGKRAAQGQLKIGACRDEIGQEP